MPKFIKNHTIKKSKNMAVQNTFETLLLNDAKGPSINYFVSGGGGGLAPKMIYYIDLTLTIYVLLRKGTF